MAKPCEPRGAEIALTLPAATEAESKRYGDIYVSDNAVVHLGDGDHTTGDNSAAAEKARNEDLKEARSQSS